MKNETMNDKIQGFCDLLDSLDIVDKKKGLWKEIYSNSLQDREYAQKMYASLSAIVLQDPTQHAIHGPNIAKYIERMSRSNDQLLKLAELIANAEPAEANETPLSPDEIYDRLATVDDISKKISGAK